MLDVEVSAWITTGLSSQEFIWRLNWLVGCDHEGSETGLDFGVKFLRGPWITIWSNATMMTSSYQQGPTATFLM